MNYGPIPDQLGTTERLLVDYLRILGCERQGVCHADPPKGKLAVINRLADALVIERIQCLIQCCEECGGTGVIQSGWRHPNDPNNEKPCADCEGLEEELKRLKEEQEQAA